MLLVRFVRFVMFCVSIVLWAILGLIIWIPLLIRTTIALMFAILHGALTNQSTAHVVTRLEYGMSFYFDGFERLIETFKTTDVSASQTPTFFQPGPMALQMLWAAFVWITFLGSTIFFSEIKNLFFSSNPCPTVVVSQSSPSPSPTPMKVSGISLGPEVWTWLWYRGTNFRIQPLDIALYSDGNVYLKISVCNIGKNSSGLFSTQVWYAPPGRQSSFNWDFGAFSLKPNECERAERWSKESINYFRLNRPYGSLYASASEAFNTGNSTAKMDLNAADSKNQVWPWPSP